MTYKTVHEQFWTDPLMTSLSNDARQVALYLLTGPQTTMIGCFHAPKIVAVSFLFPKELDHDTVSIGYSELLTAGFIKFHEESGWVWVVNYLKYNPIPNPKAGMAAMKLIRSVPQILPFYQELMQRYRISGQCDWEGKRYKQERLNTSQISNLIQAHRRRYGIDTVYRPETEPEPVTDSESHPNSENLLRERELDRGVGKGGDPPPAEPMAQPPPALAEGNSSGKPDLDPMRASTGKRGPVRVPPPDILPESWRIAGEDACPGVDADREFAKFRANYASRQFKPEKWLGLWQKWMLNDVDKAMREAPATTDNHRPKIVDPDDFARKGVAIYRRVLMDGGGTNGLSNGEEFKLKLQAIQIANGADQDFGLDRGQKLTADQLIRRVRNTRRAEDETSKRRETECVPICK